VHFVQREEMNYDVLHIYLIYFDMPRKTFSKDLNALLNK
jgi:hypothetical protein